MTSVDFSLVADAVVTTLQTDLDPILVEYSRAPRDAADTLEDLMSAPYVVVYRIPFDDAPIPQGDGFTGDGATQRVRFQLRAVAATPMQAENLANEAASRLCDRDGAGGWMTSLDVAGHNVVNRRRVGTSPTMQEGFVVNCSTLVEVWAHVAV